MIFRCKHCPFIFDHRADKERHEIEDHAEEGA